MIKMRLILPVLLLAIIPTLSIATNFNSILKDVGIAEEKKLPKTALKHIARLEQKAKYKDHKGFLLLALVKKHINRAIIDAEGTAKKIQLLRSEIERSPREIKPVMQSILAIWFWNYYKSMSYTFRTRTRTHGAHSDNFTKWDLARIFKEIKNLFDESLSNKKILQTQLLEDYEGIITKGSDDKKFCRTLYEFLLRESINFNKETMSSSPDYYTLECSSDFFSNHEKFIIHPFPTVDNDSAKLTILGLYKDLLIFLKKSNRISAFIDTDIMRLLFLNQHGTGADKNRIFQTRMMEIFKKYKKNEMATLAIYHYAKTEHEQGKNINAITFCKKAQKSFPDSDGARQCYNLTERIEQKGFEIQLESNIGQHNSFLQLRFKNMNRLHFKIVKDDWKKKIEKKWGTLSDNRNEKELQSLLDQKTIKKWSVSLSPDPNYEWKDRKIVLKDIPYGFYVLMASESENFEQKKNNQVLYIDFWKTDTLILSRSYSEHNHGLLLNSANGKPLSNRQIDVYRKKKKEGIFNLYTTTHTEQDGTFSIPNKKDKMYRNKYILFAKSDTGNVLFRSYLGHGHSHYKKAQKRVIFFTDRSIYRPGQKIFFKGICHEANHKKDHYNTFPCKSVLVTLHDTHRKKIASRTFNANKFGSFCGEFMAPSGTLTGTMEIKSSSPRGVTQIRVEEYKRASFEVTLLKPKKEFKVNEKVEIEGMAKSFSGAPLNNGSVKFSVSRRAHLPLWWRWFNPWIEEKPIKQGIIKTNSDGKFKISFLALPDRRISPETNPWFNYNISVDVIDTSGETRSSDINIHVGYVTLRANLLVSNWTEHGVPFNMEIKTETLDGNPVSKNGKVNIYSLEGPKRPIRRSPIFTPSRRWFIVNKNIHNIPKDPSDYHNWPSGKKIKQIKWNTHYGKKTIKVNLPSGAYRAELITKDAHQDNITVKKEFIVFSKKPEFPAMVNSFFTLKSNKLKKGDLLEALWGTGYPNSKAYVMFIQGNKVIKSFWSSRGTLHFIKEKITDTHKGGFTLQVYFAKENRLYAYSKYISILRPEKKLSISVERMKKRFTPGQKEHIDITIKGKNAHKTAFEMVATMYDVSLDTFSRHSFGDFSGVFWKYGSESPLRTNLYYKKMINWISNYGFPQKFVHRKYPRFIHDVENAFYYLFPHINHHYGLSFPGTESSGMGMRKSMQKTNIMADNEITFEAKKIKSGKKQKNKKAMRRNPTPLAFFKPHLVSNSKGEVRINFVVPPTLTGWKLLAMAHQNDLASGKLIAEAISRKDLMVTPNAPRFLRQGDKLHLAAKISNLSGKDLAGTVVLEIEDAITGKSLSHIIKEDKSQKTFQLNDKLSRSFSWKLSIPDIINPILYRIKAKSNNYTDGEEGIIPVLSRKILVHESKPLWISGKGKKKFKFKKLVKSKKSKTLKHHKLVLQMTSNPAWYAVQALPWISSLDDETPEQVFHKIYTASLGKMIIEQHPKIIETLKKWQHTRNMKSKLELDQDLKSIILNETPWVIDAKDEKESIARISHFFNKEKLQQTIDQKWKKLETLMLSDGGWSWFPGGGRNDFITLHILTGLGRLKHLDIPINQNIVSKSLNALDERMYQRYSSIIRKNNNHLESIAVFYLYTRSLFLKEMPLNGKYQQVINYYLGQAEKFWQKLGSRFLEGCVALGSHRFQRSKISSEIIKSLRERALHSSEMGMYWQKDRYSWWWYKAPIETQALMIETFNELGGTKKEIEKLKVWLLKQKQTQKWRTSKATTDAVYALLMRGDNLLSNAKTVITRLGRKRVKAQNIIPGSGFYEARYSSKKIKSSMGEIEIVKKDKGVAWGGLHWQYFEDISKITPHKTPLKLKKMLFIKVNTKKGPTLIPVTKKSPRVGDTLTVKVELDVDRDMEFVHMKDMRGSGTEPVNVLSTYKWQDALGYYESTRDTASHFYFDYLPKGSYVFEYDVKIFHKGTYQSGMAHIESYYAPEFNAHSKSFKLDIKH